MTRDTKPSILIINGPNLNLLGKRQVEIYGNESFESFYNKLTYHLTEINLSYFQSNHEGDIIDQLHQYGFSVDGIVLNAGAYTHTSIAIRDAIASIPCPVVEVHISDIHNREPFRKNSYLKEVCKASVIGEGLPGYERAISIILQ